MSRPTKFTYRRLRRLFRVLRAGGSLTAAAGAAGIHYSTFSDWEQTKPKFSEAIKRWQSRGRSGLEDVVSSIAHNDTDGRQLTAAMYLLNTVHGLKQQVAVEQSGMVKHEHSGEIEIKKAVKELSEDKKNRIKAILLARPSRN